MIIINPNRKKSKRFLASPTFQCTYSIYFNAPEGFHEETGKWLTSDGNQVPVVTPYFYSTDGSTHFSLQIINNMNLKIIIYVPSSCSTTNYPNRDFSLFCDKTVPDAYSINIITVAVTDHAPCTPDVSKDCTINKNALDIKNVRFNKTNEFVIRPQQGNCAFNIIYPPQ